MTGPEKATPAPKKVLPIPLTCEPEVKDGRCIHAFDNGACDLPDQALCPFFLWAEKNNPRQMGEIPQEMIDRIKNRKPVPL